MTSPITVPSEDVLPETVEHESPLPLRIGAELLGTFIVCFAVYVLCTFGSIVFSLNLAYIAIGTGLAYMAATLFLGRISGGQFNPAITVAAMLPVRPRSWMAFSTSFSRCSAARWPAC